MPHEALPIEKEDVPLLTHPLLIHSVHPAADFLTGEGQAEQDDLFAIACV
jgi:hypothetical protein